MEYEAACFAFKTVEKLARDAPLTPLPVVLYSARKTWSVCSSPVFQIDHMAGLRGTVTTVFLKMTLEGKLYQMEIWQS